MKEIIVGYTTQCKCCNGKFLVDRAEKFDRICPKCGHESPFMTNGFKVIGVISKVNENDY